jgi:murein L,D-transpeptidase YcbB/YkuD
METETKNHIALFIKPWFHKAYLTIAVSIVIGGCTHFSNTASTADVMSEANNQKTWRLDSSRSNFNGLFASSATWKFYQTNNYVPVWIKNKSNTSLADSLLYIIRMARLYGLQPRDYHLTELEGLIKHRHMFNDSAYATKADILFTDAFFTFTNHLRNGRIAPDSLTRYTTSTLSDSLQISLLRSALRKNELSRIFESQEPGFAPYHKMKRFLRRIIQSGDSLEKHMILAGYQLDSSALSSKVRALEINMERWRWEQRLKGRYIAVNIPSYFLYVVENDSVTFTSRVIVGTAKNQTPELDGLIKTFTIYPYWNVTRNIAVKEMLPSLKTDSLYLQSHQYEVLDAKGTVLDAAAIDWSQYHSDNFPFTIRQKEGIHNALGLIKFSFENPYSVYLHDTNARLMFKREKRALSHGCVRVENALELGRFLLRDNELVTPDDLDQYIEMQRQYTVRINPIPVHLRYFTCEVQGDSVMFLQDVYKRDEILSKALNKADALVAVD